MRRGAWWVCAFITLGCSGAGGGKEPPTDAEALPPDEDAGALEQEAGELADGDAPDDAHGDAGRAGLCSSCGCSSCGGCEEIQDIRSAQHKPEPINYADVPPTGGDHAACWSKFGVHAEEVPEARWVHNLEHGAVVFLHNCRTGCAAEIRELEALAKGRPFALVTPDTRLPTRFAVVAWGVRLQSECVDSEAFQSFYEKHFDHAGESTTSAPPGGC